MLSEPNALNDAHVQGSLSAVADAIGVNVNAMENAHILWKRFGEIPGLQDHILDGAMEHMAVWKRKLFSIYIFS